MMNLYQDGGSIWGIYGKKATQKQPKIELSTAVKTFRF